MIEIVKEMPQSVQLGLLVFMGWGLLLSIKAAAWFFRDWWAESKNKSNQQMQALLENTMAIQKLELQVDRLNEFLHLIPKMQSDITAAHEKIRNVSKEANGS